MSGETTPVLDLPLIAAAQAQKHVTHNAALMRLDALTQLACLSRTRTAPPPDPGEGDRYLVPDGASGAWSGWSGRVALFQDGAWTPLTPGEGWLAWIVDEAALYVRIGSGWRPQAATLTALQEVARFGLGTIADATNPFAAKLNKALWTARPAAEGGDGSLLYAMNKESAGRDLGLLLQTGYAVRAMLGLFGGDDFSIRTTPDGTTFQEALRVAAGSGIVALPRLPRFCAHLNYDAYAAADTWVTVPLNEAEFNDQGVFDAGANRFTALVAGTYAVSATLAYKANAAAPSAMLARLARSGPPAATLSAHRSGPPVAGAVGLSLAAFLKLDAGESVTLQAQFAGADGYFAKTDTRLWGHLVG